MVGQKNDTWTYLVHLGTLIWAAVFVSKRGRSPFKPMCFNRSEWHSILNCSSSHVPTSLVTTLVHLFSASFSILCVTGELETFGNYRSERYSCACLPKFATLKVAQTPHSLHLSHIMESQVVSHHLDGFPNLFPVGLLSPSICFPRLFLFNVSPALLYTILSMSTMSECLSREQTGTSKK